MGRIDVHSHLLPGLDDGCATLEESVECARALVEMGYTHAFCTPHIWPSLENNPESIVAAVATLQDHLTKEGIGLKVMGGGEINLLDCWPKIAEIPPERIVSFGMGGKYVLFDFWADTFGECRAALGEAIEYLVSRGLKPVLAHPERIEAMRDPRAIEQVTEWGALLQLNSYCLSERVDAVIYLFAERLLREGKYFLIGSDTHKPTGMNVRRKGLEKAINIVGGAVVEQLTIHNPRMLIVE